MKTATIVLAALALTGCNRALKEEQAAWARVADQKRVVMRKTAECREKVGLADLWAKLDAAEKACRPFQEAVSKTVANLNSGRRSDTDAFLVASKAQEREPACQDANRYRKLWLQADKDAQPCFSAEEKELEIRRAEYEAACGKCGIKERCANNYKHNEVVVATATILAEHPEKKTPEVEKKVHEAGDDKLVFACER